MEWTFLIWVTTFTQCQMKIKFILVDILTTETSNRNAVSKHSLLYLCFDLFIINCLLLYNLFNEIQLQIVI